MYDFNHKLLFWILCVKTHIHVLVRHMTNRRWKVSMFIACISFMWHPWLITKWHGCPIVITMTKKLLQVIWYEHKQIYPPLCTYLFTYPPTYHLSTYLFTYPPTYHLSTYLFTYPLLIRNLCEPLMIA
jgi:hypothetical protein